LPARRGVAHVLDAGRGGGRSGADRRRLPDTHESGPPPRGAALRRPAPPAASARGARVVTVVAVAGAVASKAGNGGEAWVRLSYALGFRRLGCGVRLIEQAHDATPS